MVAKHIFHIFFYVFIGSIFLVVAYLVYVNWGADFTTQVFLLVSGGVVIFNELANTKVPKHWKHAISVLALLMTTLLHFVILDLKTSTYSETVELPIIQSSIGSSTRYSIGGPMVYINHADTLGEISTTTIAALLLEFLEMNTTWSSVVVVPDSDALLGYKSSVHQPIIGGFLATSSFHHKKRDFFFLLPFESDLAIEDEGVKVFKHGYYSLLLKADLNSAGFVFVSMVNGRSTQTRKINVLFQLKINKWRSQSSYSRNVTQWFGDFIGRINDRNTYPSNEFLML